ncbi:hypothetical protein J2T18_000241 [Paenibacillus polymyxa]|nr:hypothetical protein [Paenibacillus polymyxa]MDQ0045969.1 hypothetical protein [Paenibacillus polymyxa]
MCTIERKLVEASSEERCAERQKQISGAGGIRYVAEVATVSDVAADFRFA